MLTGPLIPEINQIAHDLGQQNLPGSPTVPLPVAPPLETQPSGIQPVGPSATPGSLQHWWHIFTLHPVHNTIAIGLTGQGLLGVYASIRFILFDYQNLEIQMSLAAIDQAGANQIAVRAVVIIITTVLSMFFALKLTVLRTRAAKGLHTIIGVALFLGNAYIFQILGKVTLVEQWAMLTDTFFDTIRGIRELF